MMDELDALHPGYGWRSNKGYSAKVHQEALRVLGPTPHHRRSFGRVAQAELDFGPVVSAAE
jgi:ribonuclease HII